MAAGVRRRRRRYCRAKPNEATRRTPISRTVILGLTIVCIAARHKATGAMPTTASHLVVGKPLGCAGWQPAASIGGLYRSRRGISPTGYVKAGWKRHPPTQSRRTCTPLVPAETLAPRRWWSACHTHGCLASIGVEGECEWRVPVARCARRHQHFYAVPSQWSEKR